jgi:hypothetical protein
MIYKSITHIEYMNRLFTYKSIDTNILDIIPFLKMLEDEKEFC